MQKDRETNIRVLKQIIDDVGCSEYYILRNEKTSLLSESVKFSLIESVICLLTDSSVKK